MWLLLEGEGVLHPLLVVSLGVVLSGVCATRFLSRGGGGGSLCTTFQRLDMQALIYKTEEYLRASQ